MRLTAIKAQDLALRSNTRNEGSFTLFFIIVIFLVRNLHLQEGSCLCALYCNGNTAIFLMFTLCISLSGCPSEYWEVSLLSGQDKWQVLTRKSKTPYLPASICYRKCHLDTWEEINKKSRHAFPCTAVSNERNCWKILCLHFGKSLSFGRIFGINKERPLEFPGTSAAFKGMGSFIQVCSVMPSNCASHPRSSGIEAGIWRNGATATAFAPLIRFSGPERQKAVSQRLIISPCNMALAIISSRGFGEEKEANPSTWGVAFLLWQGYRSSLELEKPHGQGRKRLLQQDTLRKPPNHRTDLSTWTEGLKKIYPDEKC